MAGSIKKQSFSTFESLNTRLHPQIILSFWYWLAQKSEWSFEDKQKIIGSTISMNTPPKKKKKMTKNASGQGFKNAATNMIRKLRCVYIYIYTHTYTCVCTQHIYVYIYAYIHTWLRMYIYIYDYICMYRIIWIYHNVKHYIYMYIVYMLYTYMCIYIYSNNNIIT